MSDNPFAPPHSSGSPSEVLNVDQLCSIAWRQKAMLLAAMVNILVNFASIAIPDVPLGYYSRPGTTSLMMFAIPVIAGLVFAVVMFTNIVVTALLGTQVFGPVRGVIGGLLAAWPLFGLVPTILVSRKATALLRSQDIRVGFWGASLKEIRQRLKLKSLSESTEV